MLSRRRRGRNESALVTRIVRDGGVDSRKGRAQKSRNKGRYPSPGKYVSVLGSMEGSPSSSSSSLHETHWQNFTRHSSRDLPLLSLSHQVISWGISRRLWSRSNYDIIVRHLGIGRKTGVEGERKRERMRTRRRRFAGENGAAQWKLPTSESHDGKRTPQRKKKKESVDSLFSILTHFLTTHHFHLQSPLIFLALVLELLHFLLRLPHLLLEDVEEGALHLRRHAAQ